MSGSVEPRPTVEAELRRLVETDRRELVGFLETRPEENIFLLSRVALDGVVNEASLCHGRFYGHFAEDRLDGVAFFGHRRGVVLAGDAEPFVRAAATLALGREAGWVILVSPNRPAERFLSHYRWRGRAMHVNRIQEYYVVAPDEVAPDRAPARRADLAELDEVVELSERMLCEDFALAPGSLSREGLKDSMRRKIADGRTWVVEEKGELV